MANGRSKLAIGLYGVQLASRQLLGLVAQEAADRNHSVLFLGGSMPPGDAFSRGRFDVIVFSISAGEKINAPEIELLRAASSRTCCIFDTPDALNRIQDPALRAKLDLALVPIPSEVEAAERLGYRSAKFIAVPPHWSRFLRTRDWPDVIRAKLRKTRDLEHFAEIAPDDTVVVIGGGKDPEYVNQLFAAAIGVCREMFGEKFVLIARVHPNEVWPGDWEARRQFYTARQALFAGVWQIDTTSYDTIDSFLMVSDLLIGSGGLTAFIYGAMERLPMIYFQDGAGANEANLREIIGKPVWLPIDRGVAERVVGTNGLIAAIRTLATPEGRAQLLARQIAFASDEFVAVSRAFTERVIVDELERQFLADPIAARVPR